MKKLLLFLFIIVFINACGVTQTRNMLTSGNYDEAIDNAINSLKNNKDKKGKQDYIYLLEEAFAKAKERDLNSIRFWEQEGNPQNLENNTTIAFKINERK